MSLDESVQDSERVFKWECLDDAFGEIKGL